MTDPRTAQQESWKARTRAKVDNLLAREETAAETWQRGTDADACEGWEPDAPLEAEVRYLQERLDRMEVELDEWKGMWKDTEEAWEAEAVQRDRAERERDALAARLAAVEALRDSWIVSAARDECRCGGCDGCTARFMAHELRAALGAKP